MNKTATVLDKQIPEFLQTMESALRSGYSLLQSLKLVSKDMAVPMAAEACLVLEDIQAGTSLPQALDQWRGRTSSLYLDLIVAAVHVQLETGGNLANKFQFLAQLLPHLTPSQA
jgi:tight adherence protein B